MQTYDEILKSMTDKYTELSGITPDVYSDIGIRLRVLAGEIYSNLVETQWLKRQMFVSTAEGEYLDLHAEERGIKRRSDSPAVGKVTFSVSEAPMTNIKIPKGTIVAEERSLLRFETTADTVIYAGDTSATVSAKSTENGRKYNVIKGSISVMVTPPSNVESVTNTEAFTGGCDSESDEHLRERIISSIKAPVNSTNCAYYKALAEGVDGVSSAGIVPRGRGAGTVDVYIASDGSVSADNTVKAVYELLSIEREVNVDVGVFKAEAATVNFYIKMEVVEGYNFDRVRDACVEKISDYIDAQGVGGEVLMCRVAEKMLSTEGVKEFYFISGLNSDYRGSNDTFPVAGIISVSRGTV
ncbi:MAG: baseplate J/gp47 family protein [Clostridia bacterium]|nr:baseplate J/gp47 family protein [Clostridia bacterium]